jgi:hypothetical protein
MYIPRNWEFGSALAKLQNFGREGGCSNPLPSRYATVLHSISNHIIEITQKASDEGKTNMSFHDEYLLDHCPDTVL